jgi:hypothetical protein
MFEIQNIFIFWISKLQKTNIRKRNTMTSQPYCFLLGTKENKRVDKDSFFNILIACVLCT